MSNIKDTDNWFHDKLYDHQVDVPTDDWMDIDIKLTRNNFLRFGFYHFNIYYVAVFLLSLLLSGAVAIDYFIISPNGASTKTNKKRNIPAMQIPQKDSMVYNNEITVSPLKEEIDTLKPKSIIENTTFNNNFKKIISNQKKRKNQVINNIETNVNVNKTIPDTLTVKNKIKKPNDTIPEKNSDSIKVIKKTIYLKKKDVIIRDTVIRYKKTP